MAKKENFSEHCYWRCSRSFSANDWLGSYCRILIDGDFLIFAIIFVWTPPHFWALALYKSDDYKRANIPMMPLIVGKKRTVNMIIAYSFILLPVVMSLSLYYSFFYSISIFILSSIFVYLSMTLRSNIDKPNFEKKAQNLFFFSIFYLFNIFSIILIDNSIW